MTDLEVCAGRAEVDLADELTGRIPDVHTVTAASVDIALGVTVYSWSDQDCVANPKM